MVRGRVQASFEYRSECLPLCALRAPSHTAEKAFTECIHREPLHRGASLEQVKEHADLGGGAHAVWYVKLELQTPRLWARGILEVNRHVDGVRWRLDGGGGGRGRGGERGGGRGNSSSDSSGSDSSGSDSSGSSSFWRGGHGGCLSRGCGGCGCGG